MYKLIPPISLDVLQIDTFFVDFFNFNYIASKKIYQFVFHQEFPADLLYQ